jgi:hypothetical protein
METSSFSILGMGVVQALFLFLWVWFTIFIPLKFKKRGLHEAQMIATVLGILGTFLGIVVGLYHFDVANIDEAVPELLNGLRFAFVTSIVGMGWSLVLGMFSTNFGFPDPKEDPTSEEHMLAELVQEMRALREAMAGQGTDSVVTQLQKLRSDQNDNHKEMKALTEQAATDRQSTLELLNSVRDANKRLVTSFEKFTEEMAMQNVEALIQAVQQVMDDFTRVINDKLENTFNELKEAAKELVTWQREHKAELVDTTTALSAARDAMHTANETIASITEHAKAFDNTAHELKEVVDTMGAGMTGVKRLAEEMQDSGKKIREEIQETTQKSIQSLGEGLLGISEALVRDIQKLQQILTDMHNARE